MNTNVCSSRSTAQADRTLKVLSDKLDKIHHVNKADFIGIPFVEGGFSPESRDEAAGKNPCGGAIFPGMAITWFKLMTYEGKKS